MSTLNAPTTVVPLPKIDFSWTPIGANVTYSFAGNNYPPVGSRFAATYTPVGQVITFTATTDTTVPIVQYRWDLGDGTVKFGEMIGHTYVVPNPSAAASLEITDALNRKVSVSHVMILQVNYGITVSGKVRSGGPDGTTMLLAPTILAIGGPLFDGGI